MAACIERNTWNAAVAACNASGGGATVKGLGIWGHPRRTARPGLGILGDINTLDVSPSSSTQACAIAAQTPCAPPSLTSYCGRYPNTPTCLPGGKTFCATHPTDPSCNQPTVTQNLIPTPTQTTDTTKMSGFMKVGLLAALVVGGVVVYKVATHHSRPKAS